MEVVVGLDIGTTKICIIVGEIGNDGSANILAVGTSPSVGLSKGIIIDVDSTVEAICEAKEQAEKQCGFKIKRAYAGIAGGHIKSINSHGEIRIFNNNDEITEEDVENVIAAAKAIEVPDGERIIHSIPRQYIVDSTEGIKQPLGISANQLEVDVHIVTAAITSIQNIIKSAEKAGIYVENIVLQPIASSKAVLSESEKELGVVLIDIGGGTADMAIFDSGSIWHTAVIPVGGNHVTGDIAIGLKTSKRSAEEVKKTHGSALWKQIPDEEIEISDVSEKGVKHVSRKFLCQIIEARMQEIFELSLKEIERSHYSNMVPAGIVLTGGTSIIPGLTDLASEIMQYPVRKGYPDNIECDEEVMKNPIYSTGMGLLQHGIERHMNKVKERPVGFSINSVTKLVRSWFKEFF